MHLLLQRENCIQYDSFNVREWKYLRLIPQVYILRLLSFLSETWKRVKLQTRGNLAGRNVITSNAQRCYLLE